MSSGPPPPLHEPTQRLLEGLLPRAADALSWAELGPALRALWPGAFEPENPAHRDRPLALWGLAGLRMARAHGGLWFPHREVVGGAAVGFPGTAEVYLPPPALDALLGSGKLEEGLDRAEHALGERLARGLPVTGAPRTKADFQCLFDAGQMQVLALDVSGLERLLRFTPEVLLDALFDAGAVTRPDLAPLALRHVFEPLARLPPEIPLGLHAASAPRLLEDLALLFAGSAFTLPVAEELWIDVALPLLKVMPGGDAASGMGAAPAGGRDALERLLATADASEGPAGFLGFFSAAEVHPVLPELPVASAPRLFQVSTEALKVRLSALDEPALRRAHRRLAAPGPDAPGPDELFEEGLGLLAELAAAAQAARAPGHVLGVRRMTVDQARVDERHRGLGLALRGMLARASGEPG